MKKKISELNGFNQDTVLSIMVLIRESLENLGHKKKFGYLNFYCNWCVHSELTKDTICYEFLSQITEVFTLKSRESELWYNDAVLEILDLKKLRLQLIDFFKENHIPTFLFDNFEVWKHFSVYLREIISHKPIKFPIKRIDKKIKKIYDQIELMAKNNEACGCKSLWITTATNPDGSWSSQWCIETFQEGLFIQGPFSANET